MSLILITGLPGTGKSTVCAELKARSIEAYDGDEDELAHWFDANGKPVPKADEVRTPEFVAAHTRDIARQTIKDLVEQAKDKQIFLCGDPENEDELSPLFTKKFALVLDETIRQHRLDTRTNNDWGKLPHEREYDRAHIDKAYRRYQTPGYSTIDSNQPVANIVDLIISQTA